MSYNYGERPLEYLLRNLDLHRRLTVAEAIFDTTTVEAEKAAAATTTATTTEQHLFDRLTC